jgi:predicted transcriptional regulator
MSEHAKNEQPAVDPAQEFQQEALQVVIGQRNQAMDALATEQTQHHLTQRRYNDLAQKFSEVTVKLEELQRRIEDELHDKHKKDKAPA